MRRNLFSFGICATIFFSLAAPADTGDTFKLALPGYKYSFPRDHASHPEYRTEWWYYTGHLQAENGHRFGYELTFFRNALIPRLVNRASKWATRDLIVAHFAITDETTGKFYNTDRIARAGVGFAGAETSKPHIWLDAWDLKFDRDMQTLHADAIHEPTEFALDLTQHASKPAIEEGENGVSQKSAGLGHASHYYSFTRLATSGKVRIGDEFYQVKGESWFDHEFGSNQLSHDQAGWDWFSLQLADGRELMIYRMRLRDGKTDPYSSGTLVNANGQAEHLKLAEFKIEPLSTWHSPHTNADYPAKWRVSLPQLGLQFEIVPTVADQELNSGHSFDITYWEGSATVTGSDHGKPISGLAYVELTGYAQAFKGTF